VWLSILAAIIITVAILMLLDYFKGPSESSRTKLGLHWLFVIGSLFGKGNIINYFEQIIRLTLIFFNVQKKKIAGFWSSKKIRIRILMGAWLFGVVVLAALYTTELFGYLISNIPVPIVNSAEELAEKPGVDLVVAIGWAPDLTIRVPTKTLLLLTLSQYVT